MFLPDNAVSSLLSLLDAFHGVWGKHKAFLDGTVSRVLMYHLHKQGLSGWVPKLLISPTLFSWPYSFTILVPLCEDCAAQHWLWLQPLGFPAQGIVLCSWAHSRTCENRTCLSLLWLPGTESALFTVSFPNARGRFLPQKYFSIFTYMRSIVPWLCTNVAITRSLPSWTSVSSKPNQLRITRKHRYLSVTCKFGGKCLKHFACFTSQ